MEKSFIKLLQGYQRFRGKYALGDQSIMQSLSYHGQQPKVMIVACCDSRVDPALILQCEPGDLFVVRNVANIVPPYEKDDAHHGTSAALEFGICSLVVDHLILLGHSQCGGIEALLNHRKSSPHHDDFVTEWVSLIDLPHAKTQEVDDYAKLALHQSHQNCLTFPWIQDKLMQKKLAIHLWFFDIKKGQIFTYSDAKKEYFPLESVRL
jgi:carbonic anhydrase